MGEKFQETNSPPWEPNIPLSTQPTQYLGGWRGKEGKPVGVGTGGVGMGGFAQAPDVLNQLGPGRKCFSFEKS